MWWKYRTGLHVAGGAGLIAGLCAIVAMATPSPRASGDPARVEIAKIEVIEPIESIRPIESLPVTAADVQKAGDLVVHEWGTFLGMSGSDGTSLDAMYHEEHALPGFVHGRAKDQLRMPGLLIKGETPVIYFYTPRPLQVRVGVDFPQGIWTHWYPQAALVNPPMAQQAQQPDRPKDGRICWFAEVTPPSFVPAEVRERLKAAGAPPVLPATDGGALWNFAREVDAAFVKTVDGARQPAVAEYERFLFYRGLGQAHLPLHADAGAGGTLSLERRSDLGEGVRHVFVLRVEGGRGAYAYRPTLAAGEQARGVIPTMDGSRPLEEFTRVIADDLAARLTESGLYAREARAMVNTWKASYFQNDGIRVLFVLPQSWTDSFIPMRLNPRPRELVRVMVGRLELLSAERERRAEEAVRDLASDDPARRREAFAFLRDQGRYVEPIVRRLAAMTQDQQVRTLCRRLLLTDFVTDLRAATHGAVDGKRLTDIPQDLRAQLARLYREMGMAAEARAEATALWQELRQGAQGPNAAKDDAPHIREYRAAVHEALGEDRRAAETYAGRIEQQAASLPADLNPGFVAWIRDWWVGRAYAGCLVRTGQADSTIAGLQERLARSPGGAGGLAERRTSRLLLAFLLEARGQKDRAEDQWSSLAGGPALAQNQKSGG
jgi:hypothetical protein